MAKKSKWPKVKTPRNEHLHEILTSKRGSSGRQKHRDEKRTQNRLRKELEGELS